MRLGSAALVASFGLAIGCASRGPEWRPSPALERLLPDSANDWEPSLAVGPGTETYVTAGHRPPGGEASQRIVVWRSEDGERFEAPQVVSNEGAYHGDQRVVVDPQGIVYVSYLEANAGSRLRLARSDDEGRSYAVQTVTDQHVSDKPELAVSADGRQIFIAYESSPGPRLIASRDGGDTWDEGRVVVPADGRHFWPTGLALAQSGELWLSSLSVPNADIQSQIATTTTLHVFRSSDGGATWRDFPFGTSPWVPGGCAHAPGCRIKLSYIGLAVDARNRVFVAYTEGRGPHEPYAIYFRSSADGGESWTEPLRLSAARRPSSNDDADCDYTHVAAEGDGRVCVVWVDDRLGRKNVWARCSRDAGRSWGVETLLSNRPDGAPYKSPEGFEVYFGDYGGVALSSGGRLHAAWGEGSPGDGSRGEGTGAVWINHLDPWRKEGSRR